MLDTTRNMMIVRKDYHHQYHEDNMMKKGDTLGTDTLMIMKGNDDDDSQTSRSSSSNGNGSSQDYYDVMSRGSDEELSLDLSDIDDDSRKPVHDIILITDPDEGYHGDSNSDEEYLTPDECDEDMILNSILQTASHIYSSQQPTTLDKKSNDSQQPTQTHPLPHHHHHHQHQHRIQQRRGSSERTLILPRRMTSVSWSTEIVTEVRFRPSTTEEEKETFYYTSDDMIRFRREYRYFQQAQQAVEEDYYTSLMASSRLVESPLSGLINMATSYMTAIASGRSNSPLRSRTNVTRKSPDNNGTLVDTLYLF